MLLYYPTGTPSGITDKKEKHLFSFPRPRQTYRKVGTQSYRVFTHHGDSQLPKER